MRHPLKLIVFTFAIFVSLSVRASAQNASMPNNLRIFDAQGKPVTFAQVLDAVGANDVVFVGELHNDTAAHQIEQQLLEGAYARLQQQTKETRPLVLSMEMFERDVQQVLDEYLANLIQEKHFLAAARPWNNYQTDYRPLVEFARAHNVPVVAANAPERYVNRVGRLGRDSLKVLAPSALAWLAPLPYGAASPAYTAKFQEVMSGGMGGHTNPYLLDAQLLRDATMAHSIAEQLKRQKHALVLHVTGSFHTEGHLGTPEQLRAYNLHARALVIVISPQPAGTPPDPKEFAGQGDFVFVTEAAPTGRF